MKFKIDENLPLDFAQALQSVGHDAVAVVQEGLSGTPDPGVMSVCRSEDRVIVTLDVDFADIRSYPPEDTAGIIVFRVRSQDKRHLLSCLHRLIPLIEKESVQGRLWIVEEDRVRIHSD